MGAVAEKVDVEVFAVFPAAQIAGTFRGGFRTAAGVLAEDAHLLAQPERRVPDAALRDGDRVRSVKGITAAFVAGVKRISDFIGLCHPLVAVGAVAAGGVEVVQHDELIGEAMLVRRDAFADMVSEASPLPLARSPSTWS